MAAPPDSVGTQAPESRPALSSRGGGDPAELPDQGASEASRRRRVGVWLRLAIVAGGLAAALLAGPSYRTAAFVLAGYLPIALAAVWLARRRLDAPWRIRFYMLLDVSLITVAVFGFGPAFASAVVFYVALVVGSSLQGRAIAQLALGSSLLAYGAMLAVWSLGFLSDAGLAEAAVAAEPSPMAAVAQFFVVAVALVGTYAVMGRTLQRLDQAAETQQRLGEAQQQAREAKLQQQLEASHRLETVGQLAGGVAHDFNNLLTAILGYAEVVQGKLAHDEQQSADVAQIVKAGERAQRLVAQLLAFSRRELRRPKELDLNQLVTSLRPMLEPVIGRAVELEVRLAAEPLTIVADGAQLERAIMNLVVNARDAMPEGGELLITTERSRWTFPEKPSSRPPASRAAALLSVRDSGSGMSAEVLDRLFEPFFTTKEVGKGTGLGLASAYGAVRQNQGHITVESRPGRGAEFRIYLPVARAAGPVADGLRA